MARGCQIDAVWIQFRREFPVEFTTVHAPKDTGQFPGKRSIA